MAEIIWMAGAVAEAVLSIHRGSKHSVESSGERPCSTSSSLPSLVRKAGPHECAERESTSCRHSASSRPCRTDQAGMVFKASEAADSVIR